MVPDVRSEEVWTSIMESDALMNDDGCKAG